MSGIRVFRGRVFRPRKRAVTVVLLTVAMLGSLMGISPAAAAPVGFPVGAMLAIDLPATPGTDSEEIIAAALSRFASRLDELPALDEFSDLIPVSDKTIADALDLGTQLDALITSLDLLANDAANPSYADLENAIVAAGRNAVGDVLTLGATVVDDPVKAGVIDVNLTIAAARTETLSFSSDANFPISAGSLDVTGTIDADISFELDTALVASNLRDSFYIVGAPQVTVGLTASGAASFDAELGFTEVSVIADPADIDIAATLTMVDPDVSGSSAGRITFDEFDATSLSDLVSFDIVDETNPVVNLDLAISSPLAGTGNFTYIVQNLGDAPSIGGNLSDLADFQNFGVAEAVAAFDRLAALLGGLETTRRLDMELPFIGGGIGDVIDLDSEVRALFDTLVVEQHDGIDNDDDGTIDEDGEDPIAASFSTIQGLEEKLNDALGESDVSVSHSGDSLLFNLHLEDSATKNVYIGSSPPPAEEDPLWLRLPDLDVLTGVEINAGAAATLNGGYSIDLTFGFDLSTQPTESGAGQGSCNDGIDNDADDQIDGMDADCAGAPNLEERIFLDVGDTAGSSLEGTASASFSATGIDANATVGILNAGIAGASITIDGPASTGNQAQVAVDFVDTDDGRLTIRDLFNLLGDGSTAPVTASVQTSLIADLNATVPVSASVAGTPLAGGDIVITSSVNGAVTDVAQLIENFNIDASSLAASDIFSFSPCGNTIDDDGDGVVNDGCPGGPDANDDPESASTASLTQIIAAIRSFAQNLDSQFTDELETPIPLVGTSIGDVIDFADILLATAEQLEHPAEGDGSATGGPNCVNPTVGNDGDEDGDGVVNDGCPTVGDAPEGGGLAAATSAQCTNNTDDDGDGVVNDGCRPVNPGLAKVGDVISAALQEALDEAVGQDLAPTVGVNIAYNSVPNDITIELDLDSTFSEMTSFNIDLGSTIGDFDLVGVESGGDLGVEVNAHLDLDFGIDLDDLSPFVLGSSGFSVMAQADASDLEFAANIGPIEFQIGAPGDEGEIHVGAQFAAGVTGAATDRVSFGAIGFDVTPFGGLDQAACPADANHASPHDACATLPLYLNGAFLDNIVVNIHDLTSLTGPNAIEVEFPDPTKITEAVSGSLLEFALLESGVGRLIDNLASLLIDGLLAIDLPLIGDEVEQIATFMDGLEGEGGSGGLLSAIVAGGDPFEIAAAELTALGNEQEVFVALSVTPQNDIQTMSVGAATAGTFNVTLDGGAPALINWDDDGAAVTTALVGLAEIGAGNATATGPAGGPWTIEFVGDLADTDVTQLAVVDVDLVGATLAAATTQEGISGGAFTLARDGQAASDPIPWNANGAEVATALAAADGVTSVAVTGTGTEVDPWVIEDFVPANPGELVVDDGNLEGSATLALVNAIPTVADAQTALNDFTEGMKLELFNAGLLLDQAVPTQTATDVADGKADLTVTCDGGCVDTDLATTIDGIRFDILLGQVAQTGADIDFDIGIPGLDLASSATPSVSGTWRLDLGFGINKDVGFFVDTHGDATDTSDDELFIGASAFLTPASDPTPAEINGRIAFIGIDIRDGTTGLPSCYDAATIGGMCSTEDDADNDGVPDSVLPTSRVDASFSIDLTDPGTKALDGMLTFGEMTASPSVDDLIEAKIQAAADLNLHVESQIAVSGASLPRIYADLRFNFGWSKGFAAADDTLTIVRSDGGGDYALTGNDCSSICYSINLDNAAIDAGSFVSNFLAPILEDVQTFTKPLQPVIDTLNEPVPVLSDLGAGPVTLLTLAQTLGPTDNKYDLIFQLIKLIQFINSIDTTGGRVIIPLAKPGGSNDYPLSASRLLEGPVSGEQTADAFEDDNLGDIDSLVGAGTRFDSLTSERSIPAAGAGAGAAAGTGTGTAELSSDVGVSFPFLEQPSKVLGMLFGQDVDLITWSPKPLSFGFSYSQRFGPIWAVPPVFLEVGGSVSVTGRFGIGYDTQGLREILFDNAGPEAILHGAFLLDRDGSGRDVNELEVKGELFANAQVSVLIFSAGAGGSVYATIGIDLQDPNNDGKLKYEEIADIIRSTGNPFCIFNLNGRFGVKMFIFAEVDLFFWSKRWRKDLADIVLYEFKVECDPTQQTEPILATDVAAPASAQAALGLAASDRVLRLNLGADRGERGSNSVGKDIAEENFSVTQQPNGSLTVEALGFSKNFPAPAGGWKAVIANGAGDDATGPDTIILLDGSDGDPTEVADIAVAGSTPFTVPAFFVGSAGDDAYITGAGNDVVNSGAGADRIDLRSGNDKADGGTGNDSISGGPGNDNALNGGDGDDYIDGGPGADTINGGIGDDELLGGANQQLSPTEFADDGIDTIHGNEGNDDIDGGPGNDVLFGDADKDTIRGGDGDDAIQGGSGGDETECGATGGPGAGDLPPGGDVLYGGPGVDAIDGGGGDDIIVGGDTLPRALDDGDNLTGGSGCDTLWGDNINVTSGGTIAPQVPGDATQYGNDTIRGGSGNDLAFGQDGNDDIFGDDGADTINGDKGNDFLFGDDGSITNRTTATVVLGATAGDGADTINGGQGSDHEYGGGADDAMFGDDDADTMFGNQGVDTMRGGKGADEMSGNQDGDIMFGDSGDDQMWGDDDNPATSGDGSDDMRGGTGLDLIFGNDAADIIRGDSDDDRLIGGSADSGAADGGDLIEGGSGNDVIAGDNATIGTGATANDRLVTLRVDGQGAGDDIFGGVGDDRIFGQTGDDIISGGTENDYVEGNQGADTIDGGSGDDDLIGGSSADDDGVVDDNRDGTDSADGIDTIDGGIGEDIIAGDNALISRNAPAIGRAIVELFDLATVTTPATATAYDGDELTGGPDVDLIFGQGGADTAIGNGGNDYIEGNDGNDSISGGGGNDDLVGGGSAEDGVIDANRQGTGLLDVGETLISGGAGVDWIAGDNALIDRNVDSNAAAPIVLFDVATLTSPAGAGTGGGEVLISGGLDNDLAFGQAGDDTMSGDEGNDYLEGNHGVDEISGGDGDDDIIGGGSADDGAIDPNRVGNGLLDKGELIVNGDDGDDWIAGDNALISRNLPTTGSTIERAPIELFDVQTAGSAVSALVSGGDVLEGNDDEDRIFGQGNGAQPASQTDPADGRNNDFVGSAEGSADFDRMAGTADEDAAGWLGDTIRGGGGDDDIEGNHGNDLIFGDGTDAAGSDEDNILGGGSADDGRIFDGARAGVGANLLDGPDTIHGDNGDDTAGDDDVLLGDNGWITMLATVQTGDGPGGETVDRTDRDVQMIGQNPSAGTYGNDFVAGNGGHDDAYGQAGDDAVEGGWGSDALVGDLGHVTTDLLGSGADPLCDEARNIRPNQPFVDVDVCEPTTLFRLVELQAADDTVSGAVLGQDVLLGGDGDDWLHGGAGSDLLQGDGDGGAEIVDPDATYTTDVTDPNPATADVDRIFGGDSNGRGTVDPITGGDGDALWGGRGDDHGFGGNGDDMQDIRPDGTFSATWGAWAEADIESYQGIDIFYGGWDQDATQANVADNGPVDGDRVIDWAGVYNITYLCPATYGAWVTIRSQSPSMRAFVNDMALTDGALTPTTSGTSGYDEVAMVYQGSNNQNTNPIYPGTPGHFTCGTVGNIDPGQVSVAAVDALAIEGGGAASVTVSRTGDVTAAVEVNLGFDGVAEVGIDVVDPGTTATIPAGSASTTFSVSAIDDNIYEGDETLTVSVLPGTGYTIGTNSADIVVVDNEAMPTIVPGAVGVTEGDTGTTVIANLGVTLSHPSAQPITVDWSELDVPANSLLALSGVDYAPTTGTLTFAPGETAKTVPVEVIGDDVDEPPLYLGEWALILFSNPSANASIDLSLFGAGIVIIVDDD